MNKYFLYARKSTDVEDRQVLSIEAQIIELRAYAKQEKLAIIEELIEKQSAKVPGRPIFNSMLERIERSEANGILAWNPDRLARNSVDGGKVIYFLDCGQLSNLKFPTFWCDNTSQGKFMLNIAFGQSKYYVDSLSDNTKRGLRQKVRRGEYPSLAPIGYLNDPRNKSIFVDKKKSTIVKKMFELYAQNQSRLEDISHFLAQNGILSKSGKELKRDRISYILSNPFYVGLFRYSGEVHEGRHQPIISKKVFDKVQEILKQRGRPHHQAKNQPQPYCGLLHCHCGMMITAENKIKRQKNGNIHNYIYYHCSRKAKTVKCKEPWIKQENLDKQISSLLQKFSLKPIWAKTMREMLEKDKLQSFQSSATFVEESKEQIKLINTKLQRLLDSYLEQDIERETYLAKKAELISNKKSLEEKITTLQHQQTAWVEPMSEWIEKAENL
ncbi:recombinase family protein, partial [Candidatus Nomurabacteria bacterium]|nr:recombinase family protein [Candidatus Nomurabacteria bacterium]